jgi:hypothetical protein
LQKTLSDARPIVIFEALCLDGNDAMLPAPLARLIK